MAGLSREQVIARGKKKLQFPSSEIALPGKVLSAEDARALGVDPGIHFQIMRDRSLYSTDAHLIQEFRDYAKGKHKLVLTPLMQEYLEGLLGAEFCDNICHQIIAEANGRIQFQQWKSPDDKTSTWLSGLYESANLLDRTAEIHYDCLTDGNHCVAVSWDNDEQEVCLYRELWWNGIEGVYVAYDSKDKPAYAVKDWLVETSDLGVVYRRVIYYPNRLERYVSHTGGMGWEPYLLPEDNGVWPLPWLDLDGKPLGIPYIHFQNAGRGTGNYGFSELTGGVPGFQNQINDLQYAASAAARFHGFPIIWSAGVAQIPDPERPGRFISPEMGPGTHLSSPNDQAKFGSIQPGDVAMILSVYNLKTRAVSRMTRTPLHAITGGDWPSGEALARAEAPAVGKGTAQVDKFKGCWTRVGIMAIKVWNRFSGQDPFPYEDEQQITCQFGAVERRDPVSKSLVVTNLRNGMNGPVISKAESRRIQGYTDQESDNIGAEMEEEAQQDAANAALQFSRGVGVTIPINPDADNVGTETSDEEISPADPQDLPSLMDTVGPQALPTPVIDGL